MKRKRISIGNKTIAFGALAIVIFGSLMIASAEMGNSVGDTEYIRDIVIRQAIYVVAGFIAYMVMTNVPVYRFNIQLYYGVYIGILVLLLACRLFGSINGAYAWINIGGGATIQPSEFAKVFMIGFGAKLLGPNDEGNNIHNLKVFGGLSIAYVSIIALIQHDLGSAIVLFVVCYCIALIPEQKEFLKIQNTMSYLIVGAVIVALIFLSPPITEFLKKFADDYRVGRFLASADPFLYQYDQGYHLIMSMVSFANGGWFGLGYGNSIHKYMNFPNPSNDFILPVIVEELGIVGFILFLIGYSVMLYPLVKYSFKVKYKSSKMVLLGVFLYFIVHFILNVGGVSGLIPLTGVPLLMVSSGGSSLIASLAGLGLAQSELLRNKLVYHEDNSGQV